MSRFWLVPALLAAMVIGPFLIWGEALEGLLVLDPATGQASGTAYHAGILGMGLLVADLVLPIPTTSILSGLGIIYGPVIGSLYAIAGSLLAALVGYGLGRGLGRPIAARWLGDQLATGEQAFLRHGGWMVAASRWMPVLPEVISVSAGVSRMPLPAFMLAAFCGALPHCALFVMIGHLGAETPVWTVAISAAIPIVLWFLARRVGLTGRLGLDDGR